MSAGASELEGLLPVFPQVVSGSVVQWRYPGLWSEVVPNAGGGGEVVVVEASGCGAGEAAAVEEASGQQWRGRVCAGGGVNC